MWGFAPTRRDTFVSAKVSKTIPARARPLRSCSEAGSPGFLRLCPESNGSGTRSEVQSHLSTQTAFAKKSIRDSGSAAPNAGKSKFFGKQVWAESEWSTEKNWIVN